MTHAETTKKMTPYKGELYYGHPLGVLAIVLYKAVWGSLELVSGILLILTRKLVSQELLEDPASSLFRLLLSRVYVSDSRVIRTGVVIVLLGIVNLLIAAGMWYRSWKLRNAMLTFFALVLAYGTEHLILHPTWLLAGGVIADGLIVYYLWFMLPKHLPARLLKT
jgi:hypothetical protein